MSFCEQLEQVNEHRLICLSTEVMKLDTRTAIIE